MVVKWSVKKWEKERTRLFRQRNELAKTRKGTKKARMLNERIDNTKKRIRALENAAEKETQAMKRKK